MLTRLPRKAYVALAAVFGVGILVAGQIRPDPFDSTGVALTDAASPTTSVADSALRVTGNVLARLRGVLDRQRELDRLRRENLRLREWQAEAERLEWENASLRALNDVRPQPSQRSLTAQIIGGASGLFRHSIVADAGTESGVQDGAPVVDGRGLVGRVAGVASGTARILLLTDVSSRIPVVLRESGTRAILAGDGSDLPVLLLLSSRAAVQTGERVVTSGQGGLFEAGIEVGRIEAISPNAVRVAPFARFGSLGFVRILEPRSAPSFDAPVSIIGLAPSCNCESQGPVESLPSPQEVDAVNRQLSTGTIQSSAPLSGR